MVQSDSQSFFDISTLPEPYKTLNLVRGSIFATNGQYSILLNDNHLCVCDKQLNFIEKMLLSDEIHPYESVVEPSTREHIHIIAASCDNQKHPAASNNKIGKKLLRCFGFRADPPIEPPVPAPRVSQAKPISDWNVRNMCYCPSLELFIIVTNMGVMSFKLETMKTEKLDTVADGIYACTSSETTLYFLYNENRRVVLEYHIPSIKCVKRWSHSSLTKAGDQIQSIQYHNKCLALIVNQHNNRRMSFCFEFRDASTYDQLWILNSELTYKNVSCCPFRMNEWLLTNFQGNQIAHISASGQVKGSINSRFSNVIKVLQIDASILAILVGYDLQLFKIPA
jgi:hypothetical protein